MINFFIRRPHTVEQFRERGGYDPKLDNIRTEAILRELLNEAFSSIKKSSLKNTIICDTKLLSPGRNEGEYVIRLNSKKPVYAILQPSEEKEYDYRVPTIISEEMYQSWTRDGRITTIGEQLQTKDQTPVLSSKILLGYHTRSGGIDYSEHRIDELTEDIQTLLKQGIPLSSITAYKRIKLDFNVCVNTKD